MPEYCNFRCHGHFAGQYAVNFQEQPVLEDLFKIAQIVFADMILSGDNALVIGMAAAGLAPEMRKRAIVLGMALAAGLRIVFAALVSYLIAIEGILFLGGLMLAWVCWRFYNELRAHVAEEAEHALEAKTYKGSNRRQLWDALVTITVADVSMSIDNVLAVAAIARDDTYMLIFGLALAIAFMAFFATLIMRVMARYPALSWVGLAFLVYITGKMLWDGWAEVAHLLGIGGVAT
jgi:YjbE family integral membrane protein